MPEDVIKTNDDLLVKQVEPLFRATLSGGLANIFAAVLVFALLADTHHKESALWLTVFIFVLSVIRIAVSNSYLNKIESGSKNKYKFNIYLNTHTFLTFLIGIGWGL